MGLVNRLPYVQQNSVGDERSLNVSVNIDQ